jgi:hypothetical protein
VSTSSRPGEVDVDAVAAAVAACPSVAHLAGGGLTGQGRHLPAGSAVEGVRVTDDAVEVHLATRWDVPIPQAAAEVRAAVAPLAGGRPITVAVDDIDDPQAAIPATTGGSPTATTGTSPVAMPAATGVGLADPPPPDAVPSPS